MEKHKPVVTFAIYLIHSIGEKHVTSIIEKTYNLQTIFSLNLKKNGRVIASRICYLTLLIVLFSLHNLPVYPQKAGLTYMNLITSTFPVQTTLSSKNTNNPTISSLIGLTQNNKLKALVTDPCGSGGTGGEVTNAPSNVTVSPDSKVWNANNAVDGNVNTYSELRIGVQQKDVEVIQKISFPGTTYASDRVKLTLSLDTVLKFYEVKAQAYSNNVAVGTIQDLTDLLTLRPITVDFTFSPGVIFNEVRLSVIATANGQHRARINLHEIYIALPPPEPSGETSNPTPTSSNVTACEENIVLNVDNPTSGLIYKWYDSSNVLVQESTSTAYSPSLTASASPYVYYLSSARATGCTIESAKHQINLTVKPRPVTPTIALTN